MFVKPLVYFDAQFCFLGQWFKSLKTSRRRAGDQLGDFKFEETLSEKFCLLPTRIAERPKVVFVMPFTAFASFGVSH